MCLYILAREYRGTNILYLPKRTLLKFEDLAIFYYSSNHLYLCRYTFGWILYIVIHDCMNIRICDFFPPVLEIISMTKRSSESRNPVGGNLSFVSLKYPAFTNSSMRFEHTNCPNYLASNNVAANSSVLFLLGQTVEEVVQAFII